MRCCYYDACTFAIHNSFKKPTYAKISEFRDYATRKLTGDHQFLSVHKTEFLHFEINYVELFNLFCFVKYDDIKYYLDKIVFNSHDA